MKMLALSFGILLHKQYAAKLPWLLMFHNILLVQGRKIMPSTPEYERNRLARIKRNMAQGAGPLAEIKRISAELVYSSSAHNKQRRKGEDGGSGSEYEPNEIGRAHV